MNRRVLLIDSDPAFRDTLTRELARYRVVVMTEADAERALALANADAPALIVLCIEEADKKAGFRVFEKCKKGALSKVPLILVTGSVPPESFAKHRGLKVHADEYLDKRTMSTHELVGKIDGLVALGDPDDEGDLQIPVDDEIPMEVADGDVVLDEVLGDLDADDAVTGYGESPLEEEAALDAHDEFNSDEAQTRGPKDGVSVASVVAAETDAAFDALMGGFGDDPESTVAIAEAGEHRQPSISIAPPTPQHNPVDLALDNVEDDVSVPEPILDGRGRGTTPPPLVSSVPGIIIDEPPISSSPAIAIPVFDDEPEVAVPMPESIDLAALADAADHDEHPVEEAPYSVQDDVIDEEQPVAQATDMYAPVDDGAEDRGPSYQSAPAIAIDDDELVAMMDEEVPMEVEGADGSLHEVATTIQAPARPFPPVHEVVTTIGVPPTAPQPETPVIGRSDRGTMPPPDLGLDVVAEDARSEQSGVYDRRALRKIGELERQISQLKTELERARAAGESAAKGGRETQFLNLRESMLAKEKELKQAKAELETKDAALADATGKLEQAQHAQAELAARQAELDKRATDDAAKAQKYAAVAKQSEGQLAQLQQELERVTKAAAAAEAARGQLEKELATERATGKATASEAERLLRTERDQLVQRHAQELVASRAETEAARQAAISAARAETEQLAHQHQSELVAMRAEAKAAQANALGELREHLAGEHAGALEAHVEQLRAANAGEHISVVNALETKHTAERARLEAALAAAKAAHDEELATATRTHAAALAAKEQAHATLLADSTRTALATSDAHAQALAELQGAHAQALEDQHEAHEEALAAQQRIYAEALADRDVADEQAAAEHHNLVEELRAKIEREVTVGEAKLEALRREHANALGTEEQTRGDLKEQHRRALAEQGDKHQQDLANVTAEHQQAIAAAVATAAASAAAERDLLAEAGRRSAELHRAALAEVEAKHAAELQQIAASASAEVADHQRATATVRQSLDAATARHAAERAAAEEAHAAEVEQIAQSASAEIAEHQVATNAARAELAAATAEHATTRRALDEATARHAAERDALTRTHAQALADAEAKAARLAAEHDELSKQHAEVTKQKAAADAEHTRALAAAQAEAAQTTKALLAERDELQRGLSGARDSLKRSEGELAAAVQSIADRNAESRQHTTAVAERDARIAELRKEIESLETENANYQDQVLRAYQKIKTDEAQVARARKAMAIALTVLDDQGNPKPPGS